ncbi:hypothetical protein TSOC_005554, partial [Tetrabaena socialis]
SAGPSLPSAAPPAASAAKCEAAAKTLPNDPSIKAFKACAGKKPITTDCCRKLLPFAEYLPCLQNPAYLKVANNFLSGVTTVSEAQKACLG